MADRVAPLGKRVKVEKRNLEDNTREVGFVQKMYLPFQTDLELKESVQVVIKIQVFSRSPFLQPQRRDH